MITPSQTVGPFFAMRLPWPGGPFVVAEGTTGAITIVGRLLDGAGNAIPDGLIETWQADPDGRFAHPDDPRGPSPSGYRSFRGFGRCPTAPDGSYRIVTVKPGPLPDPLGPDGGGTGDGVRDGVADAVWDAVWDGVGGGAAEAPHLDVSVFARGLLNRVVTRMYFPDEAEANAADPVLSSIAEPDRRAGLIAVPEPGPAAGGVLRFDIYLQGDRETVFFDV
jgi:protocatechuate 3,4-dioxygenase, alpha subunit